MLIVTLCEGVNWVIKFFSHITKFSAMHSGHSLLIIIKIIPSQTHEADANARRWFFLQLAVSLITLFIFLFVVCFLKIRDDWTVLQCLRKFKCPKKIFCSKNSFFFRGICRWKQIVSENIISFIFSYFLVSRLFA